MQAMCFVYYMIYMYIYIFFFHLYTYIIYYLYTVCIYYILHVSTYYSTILGLTPEINPFKSEVCGPFDFQS